MTLTTEYQPYDYDYQKRVQDIKLKDGAEYVGCYPNAGNWYWLNGDGRLIPDQQVAYVRLNREEYED